MTDRRVSQICLVLTTVAAVALFFAAEFLGELELLVVSLSFLGVCAVVAALIIWLGPRSDE